MGQDKLACILICQIDGLDRPN